MREHGPAWNDSLATSPTNIVDASAVTFLDSMVRDRQSSHRFEEVVVEPHSELSGKTLAEGLAKATASRVEDIFK